MIPFDFTYYRPDTLQEAVETHAKLLSEGKSARFYAGGSETITMSRVGSIRPDAVIDLKRIPECRTLSSDSEMLHFGSVCTLNEIKEVNTFPLLRLACGRIADHTNQCRITLGGNLCGTIIYRETSQSLLLCDANITLYGLEGFRTAPFRSIFPGRMQLLPSELLVQVHVPIWAQSARCFHVKRTQNEKIDYPLVSVSAIVKDSFLRIAFSGICSNPFRSDEIETVINNRALPCHERARIASTLLPEPPHSDAEGSAEYRLFVFQNTVEAILEEWQRE